VGVGGGGGGGAGKGAARDEGAADGEDDAHGHGDGEDGGHGGDDGFDGVFGAGGGDDEPEEHVDHVDDPDGAVEVQAVSEHELPVADGAFCFGFEGAGEGEGEGGGEEERGADPVDSDPVVAGAGDAALRGVSDGDNMVESTGDGHHADLEEEEDAEEDGDLLGLVVDGADADEVDGGADGDEDARHDRFEEVELLAHFRRPFCVEECDGDDDELNGHQQTEEVKGDLHDGPFLALEELPCARRKDEGVPGSDGQGADEEILVGAEMGREVEVGGKER